MLFRSPHEARLLGTVRTLLPALRMGMEERLERIIAGVCAAFRAEYDLAYEYGCGVTVNERETTDLIARAAESYLGSGCVHWFAQPSMGGEDFSEYLKYAPGAMFRLGIGGDEPIHSPRFNFNDAAIPSGVGVFCETVRRFFVQYAG